jgi:NADH dehydrogenase FAD-containing subunit
MSTKKVYLVLRLIGLGVSFGILRLGSLIAARIHRRTYKAVAEPKQVVVVGGSFAGFFLAKQLAESLPTGYRVVLIEKHSHFHFTWNFPRISVVSGHDHEAFVPYGKQPPLAPDGVYAFRQGTVIKLDKDKATLEDGSIVKYEYLALATGSQGRYPYRLGPGDDKAACMDFFRRRQERIEHAQDIVIVGGGAAGVEVAGDTKSKYPQKKVTLVHSREHLLNSFGPGLHERAKQALEEMGVKIYLSERVTSAIDEEAPAAEVTLRSGKTLQCDALVRKSIEVGLVQESPG